MPSSPWIRPEWAAPARVRALTTLRTGGVSRGPYRSFNLAAHVGDAPADVAANRELLRRLAGLPEEPRWLKQVHGARVVQAHERVAGAEADGSVTGRPGVVCAVLTADCLPVFLCDRAGTRVGVLHAGWRGLAAGVLEAGVAAMGIAPGELLAWLGPAIGPRRFRVGPEVRAAFVQAQPGSEAAFRDTGDGKWLADLYRLARLRLEAAGLDRVGGGGFCTFEAQARFFSYRRDGACGRMASLIWLDPER